MNGELWNCLYNISLILSKTFTEINDRKSSSSSSGSPLSPKHVKPPKKPNPISPTRRRAQRRANNSSPRRKTDVEKASDETMAELSKKKVAYETNENDNSKKVEKLAIQNDPRDEKDSAKKEPVIQKPKTEKKNIAYTFPAHEETFIMEDKDMIQSKTNMPQREMNKKNEDVESKPLNNKKKLSKSPRRAKPVKVCRYTRKIYSYFDIL